MNDRDRKELQEVVDQQLEIAEVLLETVIKSEKLRKLQAVSAKKLYDAFVGEGFTSSAALELTAASLTAAIKGK